MEPMTNSEIVTLYTSFKNDARGWLSLHRQHFTQFVAIILAVLGATVAAFIKMRGETNLTIILVFGPLFSALLSFLAILVCNKFYKRYAEHDAISYKLYCLLENRSEFQKDLELVKDTFSKEKALFPERWVSRLNDAETVKDYANGRVFAINASNFFIILTFAGLIIISSILTYVIMFDTLINYLSTIF